MLLRHCAVHYYVIASVRLEELAKVHGRANPGRPRVLILAPTAELAQQVVALHDKLY